MHNDMKMMKGELMTTNVHKKVHVKEFNVKKMDEWYSKWI